MIIMYVYMYVYIYTYVKPVDHNQTLKQLGKTQTSNQISELCW